MRLVERGDGEGGAGGVDAGDLGLGQPHRVGQFGVGRRAAQVVGQRLGLAPDALGDFLEPGRLLDDLDAVAQVVAQVAVNVVSGVGDQLGPAIRVELVNGVHQAQEAFLHQVLEGHERWKGTGGPASGPGAGIAGSGRRGRRRRPARPRGSWRAACAPAPRRPGCPARAARARPTRTAPAPTSGGDVLSLASAIAAQCTPNGRLPASGATSPGNE